MNKNNTNDDNKLHIVVARYNEDINWLTPYFDYCKFYNKGLDDINVPCVKLDNIGRESHTYLSYIIDNYDNLPLYVVFIQGKLDDIYVCDDKSNIEVLNQIIKSTINNNISDNHDDYKQFKYSIKYDYVEFTRNVKNTKNISLGKWCETYVKQPFPEIDRWYKGACFGVSRERILRHDINFYKRLLNTLDNVNPISGYYLERLWYELFK